MKRFIKLQTRIFFGLLAFVLASAFFFSGVKVANVSADTQTQTTEISYIDTELDEIAFVQHPTCVYIGFKLTESDYDDYGRREGDFSGTEIYESYEKYIALDLSYWKDFSKMNSEQVIFDQLYTYWHGSAVGAWFANTVAHRTTLARLEYGFVIAVPAGTTFPSLKYVVDGCVGTPVAYKTTTDKAFYYDGTDFVSMSYKAAEERMKADETLHAVDYTLYHELEQKKVQSLVEETKAKVNLCFTTYDVQDVMADFAIALDKIMTKADYEQLAVLTGQAKQDLAAFFSGLDQTKYSEENWAKIVDLQQEANDVLDMLTSLDVVDDVVSGVKTAVGNIVTMDKATEFASYCEAAVTRLENSFNQSLYREAEKAQGLAWIEEGKQAIANATGYGEVDAIELSYKGKLSTLKTQAQWEEDELLQEENTSTSEETSDSESSSSVKGDESEEKSGCGSMVNGMSTIFVAGLAAAAIAIKKRKKADYKNEN